MARPKGYAPWSPAPETAAVVRDVLAVLEEYSAHLPLTVRQIFYRLVGQYGYEKTERAYSRLAEYLVRARRAHMIPFSHIRDDGTVGSGYYGWDSVEQWVDSLKDDAAAYQRDRAYGQPVRLELWCEASGMVPQLQRAARGYPVSVYSTGGFSSVTVTHEIAVRAAGAGVPTVFMHVGDYDPSGVGIYEAMGADAQQFLWGMGGDDMALVRVALTEEQVEEYGLPTAPPKSTDSRSRTWYGETCQAEAMPPDLLAQVVRSAVEEHMDMEVYQELLSEEEDERERLVTYMEGFQP